MLTKSSIISTINFSTGVVLMIDKPKGISSFDVIRRIKRIVRIKKIGHAGTLDPLATGLMILCTGKFTKRINEFQGQDKEYYGQLKLGGRTASYDAETEIEEHYDIDQITMEEMDQARLSFIGQIQQLPPIYSAIKVGGERLYKKAFRGENPKVPPRIVDVYSFDLEKIELPLIDFIVECSTGTYIRSIAHDFGQKLNNGAYLTQLRRTKIGEYSVDDALSLDEFEKLMQNVEIESL